MRSASCSAQLTHVCERSLVLCGSMRWFRHPRLLFLFFLLFVVFSAFCVSSLNGLRLDKPAGLPRGSYVGQQGHDQLHRDQKFTLILQTFNRSDLLMKLLNHYSGVHLLSRIIVVWNNMGELPPVDMWRKYEPHPVPVHFIQQEKNRMQNRLQPFSEIDTEGTVYAYWLCWIVQGSNEVICDIFDDLYDKLGNRIGLVGALCCCWVLPVAHKAHSVESMSLHVVILSTATWNLTL